jgi:hypothetical protein
MVVVEVAVLVMVVELLDLEDLELEEMVDHSQQLVLVDK